MLKKFLISAILIIIVAVILGYSYFPKSLDITYEAVELIGRLEEGDPVEVKLQGKLYRSILRDNYIAYNIIVDGDSVCDPNVYNILPTRDRWPFLNALGIGKKRLIHPESRVAQSQDTLSFAISFLHYQKNGFDFENVGVMYLTHSFDDFYLILNEADDIAARVFTSNLNSELTYKMTN